MAATKGNQWWRLRSKHGRDVLFSEPEKLWEAAQEYFDYTEQRRWNKKEAIKGGNLAGQIIDIPIEIPFSDIGLCQYLGVNNGYFDDFKKSKTYQENKDFSDIITRIEQIISQNQFEGATIGAFNANIIARKLGLSEHLDHSNKDGTLRELSVKVVKDEVRPSDD